jgi:hypothetical protein
MSPTFLSPVTLVQKAKKVEKHSSYTKKIFIKYNEKVHRSKFVIKHI